MFFSQCTRTHLSFAVVLKSFFFLYTGLGIPHWIFTVLTHLFHLIYLFRTRFSWWILVKFTFISHRYQYCWLKVGHTHTRARTQTEEAKFKWRPLWKNFQHWIENAALASLFIFGVWIKFLLLFVMQRCLLLRCCTLTSKNHSHSIRLPFLVHFKSYSKTFLPSLWITYRLMVVWFFVLLYIEQCTKFFCVCVCGNALASKFTLYLMVVALLQMGNKWNTLLDTIRLKTFRTIQKIPSNKVSNHWVCMHWKYIWQTSNMNRKFLNYPNNTHLNFFQYETKVFLANKPIFVFGDQILWYFSNIKQQYKWCIIILN